LKRRQAPAGHAEYMASARAGPNAGTLASDFRFAQWS
jgi:hypothetical protein